MAETTGAKYVVFVAYRKERCGSTFGYFRTLSEVPADFKNPRQMAIDDIMESLATSDIDCCLRTMNSHWK